MINSVTLMGGLTADPVIKEVGGTQICSFSVAVEEVRKDEKYQSYFECVLFGKSAGPFCQYMAKGRKVCIQGALRQDRWKDKESGAGRSKVVVIVNQWQMCDSKAAGQPASKPATGGDVQAAINEDMPF